MTEDRTIKFIKDVLLNGNNPRGKEAENNLRWGLQEYLKEQLKLYGVVQQSELLKGKYTKDFEDWLLGFENENEKYIVDDEQINTKEEMYDLYREL